MFSGPAVASLLQAIEVSHVVTVPDSTIGRWDDDIMRAGIEIVRVCREGEAWAIAGGLQLGGMRPLVLIQCTGLFESGDALRNIVHEWGVPLYSFIGYRSYLSQELLPGDTSLVFTEPILQAWKLDTLLVTRADQHEEVVEHHARCRAEGVAGVALIAEGRS